MQELCIVCQKIEPVIIECSSCKSRVCYCSKECQVYDWNNHKQQCILLKTISNIERHPAKLISIMNSPLVKKVENYMYSGKSK
jgi:hypothetical protein